MSVWRQWARAPWAWRLADGTIVGMNVIGLRVRPGACHRCRFLADFVLKLLVDKVAPELLLLDCAAEAGTGPSRPIHDAPTPGPQRAGNFKIW